MDSLGIDENNSPVIFEYKRAVNENVINQGLFYLDWLMDHRGDFTMLVLQHLGSEAATSVDWRNPRLICVASGFTRYDEHAVQQMNRSIELVRYRDFSGELLALELMTGTKGGLSDSDGGRLPGPKGKAGSPATKTVTEYLEQASTELRDLYESVDAFCVALGDDVTKKALNNYFAFRRLKNFACVEVHPQSKNLLVYLRVDPQGVMLAKGFARDVSSIGHFGTGNLELRLHTQADFRKAQPLIQQAYEDN